MLTFPASSLDVEQLTQREVMWLCNKLSLSFEYQSTEQIRSELMSYVNASNAHYTQANDFYRESKYQLMHDAELTWIKETDTRLLRWIIYYLLKEDGIIKSSIYLSPYWPDGIKYERFINALDIWNIAVEIKKSTIERAKFRWSEILLQNKKLKWLEPQNKVQIEWAWKYINENKKHEMPPRSATSTNEMYLGVIEIFDCWQKNPAELKDFRDTMKRAWAQHKYRLNLNGKKQSTFVLSIEAKVKLQQLAKAQNVNMNQMLEYIINKEATQRKAEARNTKGK